MYQLDKRLLDPRRPVGPPSQQDQLEQLIPYHQNLFLNPLLYATHRKQVAQLSGGALSNDDDNKQQQQQNNNSSSSNGYV